MASASEPAVSIVIAAYGRPEVLNWAIRSVQAQTWRDWELIVVGDDCRRSAEFMAANMPVWADDRIRFFNLARNAGEQSGPNNFGVARARGRCLAFLNQDDIWFPDHLHLCLEALDTTGADLVFSYSGAMARVSEPDLAAGNWFGGLTGVPRDGGYDPATTFAPASSWLMRREVAATVGPWKAAAECVIVPSRDFLFRAWRKRLRIRSCPEITVLTFSSGGRPASYLRDASHEQRWWFESVGLHAASRAALWNRLAYRPRGSPLQRLGRGISAVGHGLMRIAVHLGLEPLAPIYLVRNRAGKGAYIDKLRRVRGLEPLRGGDRALRRAQRRAVEQACDYVPGEMLDFSPRGNAHRYQLDGWAFPENWGTWTEGDSASLMFRLPGTPSAEWVLSLEAQGFATEDGRRQRALLAINGVEHACLFWLAPGFIRMEITLPREVVASHALTTVSFSLPDNIAPARVARVKDYRCLGIGFRALTITPGGC